MKKRLYLCTRKNGEVIFKKLKKIFKKIFGRKEKRLYLCTREKSDKFIKKY